MKYREFDTCWERANEIYERLGPGARLIQVAGYQGNTDSADQRWLDLPPRAWTHYVAEKDGIVHDPTASQFDPDSPKEYDYDALLEKWSHAYVVKPQHKTVK